MKLRTTLTATFASVLLAAPVAQAAAPVADNLPEPTYEETQRLGYSTTLGPGSRIVALDSDASCTVGWVAEDTTTGKKGFVTAGHCAREGETVYVEHELNQTMPVGVVEWNAYDSTANPGHDSDIAFVSVEDESLLSTNVHGVSKPASKALSSGEYESVRPDLCKVGFATGTTCGDSIVGPADYGPGRAYFQARSAQGDSGSPVFAQTRSGQVHAVGILTGEVSVEPEHKIALMVSEDLQRELGFELVM